MINQEILDNAPDGATHIDNDGEYAKEDGYGLEYFRLAWHKYTEPVELRSLADIKRIVELEKEKAIGVYHFTVEEYKAHNLEQQASGIEVAVRLNLKSYSDPYVIKLMDRAAELREQSEALKEQVK